MAQYYENEKQNGKRNSLSQGILMPDALCGNHTTIMQYPPLEEQISLSLREKFKLRFM